jgi:hypothetical protein
MRALTSRLVVVSLCLVVVGCAPGETDGEPLARKVATTTTAPASRLTTTSSSLASTSTTTSTSSTVPSAGDVVLEPDGLAVVAFGDEISVVLAELATRLGPPIDDDPLPACPSGELDRLVQFAELSVLVATTEGAERFVAWDLGASSGARTRLVTAEGISVGSTLAQLRSAYGERLDLSQDDPFGPAFELDVGGRGRLGGTLTGTGAGDTVATLSGGSASCG